MEQEIINESQEMQVAPTGENDKVYQSLYKDSGLESDGVTFEKFKTTMQNNPEARKSLYTDLGFESEGISYDIYEQKLGLGKSVPKGGAEPSLGGELQSKELPEIDLPTAMKLKKDIAGVTSAQGLTDLLARPEYKNIAQYAKQFSGLSPLQLREEISKISVPEKSKKALNYLAKSDKDFYKGERDLNVEGANVLANNINQATQTLQSSEQLLKNGQELFAQYEQTQDPTPIIESLRQLGIQADENNWQQESERLFNTATENIRIAQETLPSQYKEYEKAVKNAETFDRAVVAFNNDEIRRTGLPFQEYIVNYNDVIKAKETDKRQQEEAKTQSSFDRMIDTFKSTISSGFEKTFSAIKYMDDDWAAFTFGSPELRDALDESFKRQNEIIDLNMPNADEKRMSKDYFGSVNPSDWNWYKIGGDVASVSGSMIPIMAAGLATGGTGAALTGGAMVYGDIFNSAKSAGMENNEAALYASGLSVAIGLLEKTTAIPLMKYFKGEGGKQLAKKFAKDLIGSKSIKDYTKVALKTAYEGAKNVGGETVTEVLQEGVEGGSQLLLNENTDLNFQDAPKTIGELGDQMIDVAKSTAVGLTPLTGLGGYNTSRSAMNQLKKNAIYNHIVELRSDPELISKKLEYLNGLVTTGKLDPKVFEAEQVELGRIADVLDLYPEINNAEKLTDITELYAEKQTLQERDKLREEKGLPKSNDQRIKDIDTKISEIANSDEYYTELSDIADKGVRDEMAGIMRTRDGLIAELPNADPLLKDKFQEQIDNANNKLTELRNEYFGEVETTEQAAETVVEETATNKVQQELLDAVDTLEDNEVRVFPFESLEDIPESLRDKAILNEGGKRDVTIYGTGLTGLVNRLLNRGERTITKDKPYYNVPISGAELREIAQKAAEQSAPMPEGVKVEGANTQTDENLRNEKRGQEGRQEVELQVAEDVGGEIAPDVSTQTDEAKEAIKEQTPSAKERSETVESKEKEPAKEQNSDDKERENPALKDVESTANALKELPKDNFTGAIDGIPLTQLEIGGYKRKPSEQYNTNDPNSISKAYHLAKKDGSNPELVKAVEELLTPNINEKASNKKPDTEELLGRVSETGDKDKGGQSGEQLRAQAKPKEVKLTKAEKKAVADKVISDYANRLRDLLGKSSDLDQQSIFDPITQIENLVKELVNLEIEFEEAFIKAYEVLTKQFPDQFESMKKMDTERVKDGIYDKVFPKERVSRTFKKVEKALNEKGLGAYISNNRIGNGTYDVQTNRYNYVRGEAIIEAMGLDNAVQMVREGRISDDLLIIQILDTARFNAKEQFKQDPSNDDKAKVLRDAEKELEVVTGRVGRTLQYIGALNKRDPDFIVEQTEKDIVEGVKQKMSEKGIKKGANSDSEIKKAKSVKEQAIAIRNDVINNLGAVIEGVIPVTELYDPNSKRFLSDNKIKKLIKTVIRYGELSKRDDSKSVFAQIITDSLKFGSEVFSENKTKLREELRKNLREFSDKAKFPMKNSDIDMLSDYLTQIVEEETVKRIEDKLKEEYNIKENTPKAAKVPKIARLIMYGTLDNDTLAAQFAELYGFPSLTAENKVKLKELARNIRTAKGGTAHATAVLAFNNYVNKLKARSQTFSGIVDRINSIGIGSFLVDNILGTATSILFNIMPQNLFRYAGYLATAKVNGKYDFIKDATKPVETQFVVGYDKDGNPIYQTIKLNYNYDAMYSAARNVILVSDLNPNSLSKMEMAIRDEQSKLVRNLRRIFQTSFPRVSGIIDAIYTRRLQIANLRIATNMLLNDKYNKRNEEIKIENKKNEKNPNYKPIPLIKFTDREIKQQADDIIGIKNGVLISKAAEQALKDMESNVLWKQLGINQLPESDPRNFTPKGLISKEGKAYNEFINRVYEIIISEKEQRIQEVLSQSQIALDGVIGAEVKSIDKWVENEIRAFQFMGKPRGSAQYPAESLSYIGNSIKPAQFLGYFPLFISAMMQSISAFVDMTPGVNLFRPILYQSTGTRDIAKFVVEKRKGENYREIEYTPLRNYDRKILWERVMLFNLLPIAAVAYWYADDDDEKYLERQKKFVNKEFTGITGKLPREVQELYGYEEYSFYLNGNPMGSYKNLPMFGNLAFIASMTTNSLFSGKKGLVLDPNGKEFRQILGNAYISQLASIGDMTQLKTTTNLVSALFDIEQRYERSSDAVKASMEKSLGTFIQNLLPKSGMLRDVQNVIDYASNENQKVALDLIDRISINMLYADNLIDANKFNIVGEEVKEKLKFKMPINPIYVFDESAKTSKKLQVFQRMGTLPLTRSMKSVTYIPDADAVLGMAKEEQSKVNKMSDNERIAYFAGKYNLSVKELKDRDIDIKIEAAPIGDMIDKLTVTYMLDEFETKEMNDKAGKMIGELIESVGYNGFTGRSLLEYKDDEVLDYRSDYFKEMMQSYYNIASNSAIIEIVPDLIGKGYKAAVEKQIADWEAKYGFKMPESVKKNTKSN